MLLRIVRFNGKIETTNFKFIIRLVIFEHIIWVTKAYARLKPLKGNESNELSAILEFSYYSDCEVQQSIGSARASRSQHMHLAHSSQCVMAAVYPVQHFLSIDLPRSCVRVNAHQYRRSWQWWCRKSIGQWKLINPKYAYTFAWCTLYANQPQYFVIRTQINSKKTGTCSSRVKSAATAASNFFRKRKFSLFVCQFLSSCMWAKVRTAGKSLLAPRLRPETRASTFLVNFLLIKIEYCCGCETNIDIYWNNCLRKIAGANNTLILNK